ncbi:MAG: nicotinate (nicotinamide) nucleotide adenylyltransferase [Dehalococcoidia bacterium]|nr:nicotinate (nicotinamide) nucleotide adenylyltransferase [Dehalococcoidia bacterium]
MPTVLLGGTFDPPHLGHLVLGECARAQVGAERVVWLVAGDPWRKHARDSAGRAPSAAVHRLAMVRLAVDGNAAFVVDDREVRRAGPTYTVETLREIAGEEVGELVLVLGSDALADMPAWKEPSAIGELARVLIAVKPGGPGTEAMPALARAAGLARAPELLEMPAIGLSSTVVRARVAAGRPIRYLVPDGVERYIRERGLYSSAEG